MTRTLLNSCGSRTACMSGAVASGAIDRAKVEQQVAIRVGSIAYRHEDDIAFVTLHVFEVAHKQRLMTLTGEILVQRRFGWPATVQLLLHGNHLRLREGDDAD